MMGDYRTGNHLLEDFFLNLRIVDCVQFAPAVGALLAASFRSENSHVNMNWGKELLLIVIQHNSRVYDKFGSGIYVLC